MQRRRRGRSFLPECVALWMLLCYSVKIASATFYFDLSGKHWVMTENNTGIQVWAQVPGSMYTALRQAGHMKDPLYRDNDRLYAWLANVNWMFSRTFIVSQGMSNCTRVLLVFEGLDTLAKVVLNGHILGQTDNMFVAYTFDVTGKVKQGKNKIVVNFKSAVKEAKERAENSPYRIPPDCPISAQHQACHINHLRKEQRSFGWDWGPSYPTQGIWKPVYLHGFDTAVIRAATATPEKVNNAWRLTVEVFFDVALASGVIGHLNVSLPDLSVTLLREFTLTQVESKVKVIVNIPKDKEILLWWPNGYGSQPLYDVHVTFQNASEVSTKHFKVGFRQVELVQTPVSANPKHGLSFYFRINGLPIFLKGTNWIPADSFQENVTLDRVTFLLQSSVDVGMNSIRVWGGGVYESEDFYNLCDKLGILVWQDFMFSVALYPAHDAFLKSVEEEVTYQVRRLKHHPSILLWAGNNENEAGLAHDWYATKGIPLPYRVDYVKLYVETIKQIVEKEDPSRIYLASSPTNGKQSEEVGYIAGDPQSQYYGDVHFYNYESDQWLPSTYPIPRMASEYGFQSWCSFHSLEKVLGPTDLRMDSEMVTHRQHLHNGNAALEKAVGLHFNLSTSSNETKKFADFIYLTQIEQAMAVKTQTENYRGNQGSVRRDGRGLTMGALYWQLNDVWQAPSWSSIDYSEQWKMLHYYAKDFFASHLISPYFPNNETLQVSIAVDQLPIMEQMNEKGHLSFVPMRGVGDILKSELPYKNVFHILHAVTMATTGYLRIDMHAYFRFKPLFSWTVPYKLKTTADVVFRSSISQMLSESSCLAREYCMLSFTAVNSKLAVQSTASILMSYPKDIQLQETKVKINKVIKLSQLEFQINLISEEIALFVWLSAGELRGHFSENGFHMLSPRRRIRFYCHDPWLRVEELRSRLSVKSLIDVK